MNLHLHASVVVSCHDAVSLIRRLTLADGQQTPTLASVDWQVMAAAPPDPRHLTFLFDPTSTVNVNRSPTRSVI